MLDRSTSGLLLVVGGLAVAAGSLMTWATFFGISVRGPEFETEDWVTALIAGIVLVTTGLKVTRHPLDPAAKLRAMFAYWNQPQPVWIGPLALLFGAGVTITNFIDVLDLGIDTVGIGLWLMAFGCAVSLVGLVSARSHVPLAAATEPNTAAS